jgi:hypothetical protein
MRNSLPDRNRKPSARQQAREGIVAIMKTVFVCSTIWDLVDVRAEIREFLQRNGFQPAMSEYEGFPADLSPTDTYQKCLEAARTCDIFLLVLNNRYGGARNPKPGELSIIHQEFRAAMATQRPFIGFVREKLETDWQTWKQAQDPKSLTFVTKEKDRQLFTVLEEINTSASGGGALWRDTFKDSIDLKRKLAFKLGIDDFSNNYVAQAQMLHALPRVTFNVNTGQFEQDGQLKLSIYLHNVGSGTVVELDADLVEAGQVVRRWKVGAIKAGQPFAFSMIFPVPGLLDPSRKAVLKLRYSNILGSNFETEYLLDFSDNQVVPRHEQTYFGAQRVHP